MTTRPTPAERLDQAIDAVLAGSPPPVAAAVAGVSPADRPLVDSAAAVRATLATSLVAPRFEARLGARLAGVSGSSVDPPPPRPADRDRRRGIGGGSRRHRLRRVAQPHVPTTPASVAGGQLHCPSSSRSAGGPHPRTRGRSARSCDAQVFNRQLERDLRICPSCGHHFRMSIGERIDMLLDPNSFEERDAGIVAVDRLGFHDDRPYPDRLEAARVKTGLRGRRSSGGSARSRASGWRSRSSTSGSWAAAWEASSARRSPAASRPRWPSGSRRSWSAPRAAPGCRRARSRSCSCRRRRLHSSGSTNPASRSSRS